MCLCLVISQFRRTERKTDLPNLAQINGNRPTLKITYNRKAIHSKICLPQNLSHFLSPFSQGCSNNQHHIIQYSSMCSCALLCNQKDMNRFVCQGAFHQVSSHFCKKLTNCFVCLTYTFLKSFKHIFYGLLTYNQLYSNDVFESVFSESIMDTILIF